MRVEQLLRIAAVLFALGSGPKARAAEPAVSLGDLSGGAPGSAPTEFTPVGDRVFFIASDAAHGRELWATDGTPAGTHLVADLLPGAGNGFPYVPIPLTGIPLGDLVAFAGDLFAIAAPGGATQLWRSDGTAEGTHQVAALGGFDIQRAEPTVVGSRLFFVGYDSVHGREIWVSDGTTDGTHLVEDNSNYNLQDTYSATHLTPYGDGIIYAGIGGTDFELWRSDGSAAGTEPIADVNPEGPSGAGLDGLALLAGAPPTILFSAATAALGSELWRSDGTVAGTTLVRDINPAPGPLPPGSSEDIGSHPVVLTRTGNSLSFFANDGTHGAELWRSDGSGDGTYLVYDINPGPQGSLPLAPRPPFSGSNAIVPATSFVELRGLTYFFADDGAHGAELWVTDGTAAGTTLVADMAPGAAGSSPSGLIRVRGVLVFRACDAAGCEPWRSDGTAAGTRQIVDLAPGAASSTPAEFTVWRDRILFRATDGVTGEEPWALPLPPPCAGDCDDDGVVAINELVTGIGIVLGGIGAEQCAALGGGTATPGIDAVIAAVNRALSGCAPAL